MTESVAEYEASVERLSDIERKVAVQVPWEHVRGRLDDAYLELGRGVTIKGFRRGKVPRQLLKKMFGEQVNGEVTRRLVQESIVKVFTEHDLSPIAEPTLDQQEIVDGEAFCYSAVIQVVPEVEPQDYFGAEVSQRPPKVDDADVEKALATKQRELTDYRLVEGRNTRAGDVVVVDVMGKVDQEPVSLEKRLVELGESPVEPLPGLAAALTDIAPDCDDMDLELELPADAEGGAVRRARLLVTVVDVKEKIVPALDDELAKDTGEAQTLDELRGKLRKQLLEEDESRAVREAKDRLMAKLLESNTVPLVPALVDRQVEQMVQMQKMLFGAGIDEQLLREHARPDAEKAVSTTLLIGAIGKRENVEVEDADVEKKLAEMAAMRQQNVAKTRAEYEKEGRMEQLRHAIRDEKTTDLLMSRAKVTIEEIVADEPDPSVEHGADQAETAASTDAAEAALADGASATSSDARP